MKLKSDAKFVEKLTEELCIMTVKNDFEEELTFKIDIRNSTNFDPSTRKSQKFAL